uniref:Reverse transcriptase n=2 Tax=Mycena chlorophos TaxID=658473 RepID=A0ABQ0LJT5_MYCCL|nr:reverse transcriptase [Mycena chlorophos]
MTDGIPGKKSPYLDAEGNPLKGSVVMGPDAAKVFRKMELDRMERNRRREEARKEGQLHVSDDEEDLLAPYFVVAAAGASSSEDPGSKAATAPPADTEVLFPDDKAEKNEFRALDDSIPSVVAALAKAGLTPPLTLFLPESLHRLRSQIFKTVKHGAGDSSRVNVIDVSDFPSEDTLDAAGWMTVYNSFLIFMGKICGQKVSLGWAEHYSYVIGNSDFRSWFDAYRSFDREMRDRFFSKAFIIDTSSIDYQQTLQNHKNRVMRPNPASVTSALPAHSTGPGHGGKYRSEFPRERPSDRRPYDRESNRRETLCFRSLFDGRVQVSRGSPMGVRSAYASAPAVHATDFRTAPAPTPSTSAPFVPIFTTERRNALATDRYRVVTPYRPAGWARALSECRLLDRYPNLIHDISFGAPIGNPPRPNFTFIPDNLKTTELNPSFIDDYISSEVRAGRMSGPYTREEAFALFGGHFRTSPLGLVEKEPGGGKWRMIQNHSAPDDNGASTNSWLDPKDIMIRWYSAASMADTIASAPPGAQVACLDQAHAYRCSPVSPDHKWALGVSWRGAIWADHAFPFGLSTSGNVQGTMADALVDVLLCRGIGPTRKWVDDFVFFRFPITSPPGPPFSYSYDLSTIYSITNPLGFEWNDLAVKGHDFAFSTDYVGFHWDIATKRVSLSEKKRTKYLGKVLSVIEAHKVRLPQLQSLIGTLQHLCFVYRDGRSRLPALSAAAARFPHKFAAHEIKGQPLSDLQWWKDTLSLTGVSRSLLPRACSSRDIWVDASTDFGIGVLVDGWWGSWRLLPGWKSDGRDIGWAESIAVEIACLWLIADSDAIDTEFVIHGDNSAVIDAYKKGRSRNEQRNLSFRRITELLLPRNLSITPLYVPSERNLADPLSRGIPGPSHRRIPFELALPPELSPFLVALLILRAESGNREHPPSSTSPLRKPPSHTITKSPRSSANPFNQLAPSSLRPKVLARDRIRSWQTPYSFHAIRSLSQSFPADLITRWQHVLEASVEASTREGYGAGLLRFNHFCDLHRIPESDRMPASEALLGVFISSYGAGRVAPGTVSTWLAGLQLWHAVNFAPWFGDALLSRTRKGVAKLAPSSSRKPPRDPVTINHLVVLRDALDLTNTRDAAIWAVACCAWRGCTRLGELLFDSAGAFNPKRNVSRNCEMKRGSAANQHAFISFKIPWTKTRLSAGDWVTLTQTEGDADAVSALEHHLFVNTSVPGDAPLFAYTSSAPGGWSTLTRPAFIARCNDIWSRAGMGALEGHGFRIGGTTFLLLKGVDPWIVMRQGRWTSSAFLLYWRSIEEILPLFIVLGRVVLDADWRPLVAGVGEPHPKTPLAEPRVSRGSDSLPLSPIVLPSPEQVG